MAPCDPCLSECSDFSPPVTVILLIFLCLEGLLFFTFTAVMFGTQIHSICNDETVGHTAYVHIHVCPSSPFPWVSCLASSPVLSDAPHPPSNPQPCSDSHRRLKD